MFLTRWGHMKDQSDSIATRSGWFPLLLPENPQIKIYLEKYLNPFEDADLIKYQSKHQGLGFELMYHRRPEKILKKKELIIYLHGMKRNAKYIRYLTHALTLDGSIVFVYNARTTNAQINRVEKSKFPKKYPKKNRGFFVREDDFEAILNFFLQHPMYKDYKINIIAESIGAITAAGVIFKKGYINKIHRLILISLPSVFNKILRKHLIPFSRSWIIRLNYMLKGIHIYPNEPINSELSPISSFFKCKQKYTNSALNDAQQSWAQFINNKLLLLHSKTDGIFKIRNFYENIKVLELSDKNFIEFRQGGHNQIRNELAVISIANEFFNRNN